MDTSRISFGEMIAGVSGLVLLISLFLPWYGVDVEAVGVSANAWESLSFIDILLFLIALVAIGQAVARATGNMPDLPAPIGQIVMIAGIVALLLVLLRLIDIPAPDVVADSVDFTRKFGIILALLAAAGIAFGGLPLLRSQLTCS